jgi:hypothetical protein
VGAVVAWCVSKMAQIKDPIELFFVDRDGERKDILRNPGGCYDPRIFCLKSESGWGKTWLMKKFARESALPGWFSAYLNLAEDSCSDAEKLLRKIGKEFGMDLQQKMDQVHDPGSSINIQAAGDVKTGDVILGDKINLQLAAGVERAVVTKFDPHGYDMRVKALAEIFLAAIQGMSEPNWAMLFMDNFEAVKTPTLNWLEGELFPSMRDGSIDRLIVVTACTSSPTCFQAEEWHIAVKDEPLNGLPEKYLLEYLIEKRKLPAEFWETFKTMARGVKGRPDLVAFFADTLAAGQHDEH